MSKQPVLLKDLLVANRQFNEKLQVDNVKLGYRLKIGRAYFVYIVLISLFAIPIAAITHKMFVDLDTHASIVASIIFTAVTFICFNFFRIWLKDRMAEKVIRAAWKVHFPYFAYDEYKITVERIFTMAMKNEISRKDLEKYILDNLVKDS
jgi:hypothetical protein